MQHNINLVDLQKSFGAHAEGMVSAIEACVHCGFCLPSCPTYLVLREEMDSPRGRIMIMKAGLEDGIAPDEVKAYIDRCLGCLSCVTACPSGVRYNELLHPFRSKLQHEGKLSLSEFVSRKVASRTMPNPDQFRVAARLGKIAKPFTGIMPDPIQRMLTMLPDQVPEKTPLPELTPAKGKRRARVALLSGCVQQVLSPSINLATIRVLSQNGIEVIIPPDQVCCGAILLHNGDDNSARRLALRNLDAFAGLLNGEYDALITNAAGCGSGVQEYVHLFLGTKEENRARLLAERSMDLSVFLAKIGLQSPPPLPQPVKVAYHDACHLAHAQKVTQSPRDLLRAVPNLTLLSIEQNDICCGSAGMYQFEQPHISAELGQLKAENILKTGCEMVATGNIGCQVQIRHYLQKAGVPIPVVHTIELLDLAYQNNGK